MHGLEIPFHLAGVDVECHDGITEQVVAFTIAAVEIAGRAAIRGVKSFARLIDSHGEAPVVDAGAILPAAGRPGLIARLAGAWHGVELPQLGAGARVVSARIAGSPTGRLLSNVLADKQIVLTDRPRRLLGHHRIPPALL